jgi:hypothetical protein
MTFYNSISDGNNFVISFSSDSKRDFGVFAKGYAQAASTLAEFLLEKPRFSDYEAYPVVFLYRHAFELYLKAFYYKAGLLSYFKNVEEIELEKKQRNNHALVLFAEVFKKLCRILFPSDQELLKLSDKVHKFAFEFEQIDKDSYSYRYPINRQGTASTRQNQTVNLLAFYQSMQELMTELEVVDFGFDIETDQAQDIFEVIQKTQELLKVEN